MSFVATMGLAAGINFSMRSVLITDTRYKAGNSSGNFEPDQLLQNVRDAPGAVV